MIKKIGFWGSIASLVSLGLFFLPTSGDPQQATRSTDPEKTKQDLTITNTGNTNSSPITINSGSGDVTVNAPSIEATDNKDYLSLKLRSLQEARSNLMDRLPMSLSDLYNSDGGHNNEQFLPLIRAVRDSYKINVHQYKSIKSLLTTKNRTALDKIDGDINMHLSNSAEEAAKARENKLSEEQLDTLFKSYMNMALQMLNFNSLIVQAIDEELESTALQMNR